MTIRHYVFKSALKNRGLNVYQVQTIDKETCPEKIRKICKLNNNKEFFRNDGQLGLEFFFFLKLLNFSFEF